MTKTFTLEELIRFNEQGTLEQHILSNGLLSLDVLKQVLSEAKEVIDCRNKQIGFLEEMIGL